jgi:hypothetical protein
MEGDPEDLSFPDLPDIMADASLITLPKLPKVPEPDIIPDIS